MVLGGLWVIVLGLSLWGCGGSTTRYDPGAPTATAGLTATAGNNQVALSWATATNAKEYVVYYSTNPGVTKSTGTKFTSTPSTTATVTGLTNGTTYYFVVTSINANSESAESNQAAAMPSASRSFSQSDLTGTWNFNILVSGSNAKWMRGSLSVDANGAVTFNSFLDSSGGTVAPTTLFPALYLDSNGQVLDVASGTATFRGVVAANTYKDMIVGTSVNSSASSMIAILQKQVSGITFSAADIQGFGSFNGSLTNNARYFVYNQVSSGSAQEWEYAAGQIGQDRKVQYSTFTAPSAPTMPTSKATLMNIDGSGVVSETLQSVATQPKVVIGRGIMSADKSVIVATETGTNGTKYVLRIYQFVNLVNINNTSAFRPLTMALLDGNYSINRLTNALSAYGSLQVSSGAFSFLSYLDSSNAVTPPSISTLTMDTASSQTNGVLTNSDSTFHGKLSYFSDILVATRSESNGNYSLFIGLK